MDWYDAPNSNGTDKLCPAFFYFEIFTELGARYAGFRQLQVLPGRTHFPGGHHQSAF